MDKKVTEKRDKVKFIFDSDTKLPFSFEKSEGGRKRRYLQGVASGLKTDADQERMSKKAIEAISETIARKEYTRYRRCSRQRRYRGYRHIR